MLSIHPGVSTVSTTTTPYIAHRQLVRSQVNRPGGPEVSVECGAAQRWIAEIVGTASSSSIGTSHPSHTNSDSARRAVCVGGGGGRGTLMIFT